MMEKRMLVEEQVAGIIAFLATIMESVRWFLT